MNQSITLQLTCLRRFASVKRNAMAHMRRTALAALLLCTAWAAQAQKQLPTDSIVADFNEFIRLLEETHPDPYTNYGGRPFFRQAAMQTRAALVADSVTSAAELSQRIRTFLVPLRDGHTSIRGAQGSALKGIAPIIFEAINDGIIVKHLPNEHKALIGSRLLAIEGVAVADVCNGLAQHFTVENESGKRQLLCMRGMQPNDLRLVIPHASDESVTYQIETPSGKRTDLKLNTLTTDQFRQWHAALQPNTKAELPTDDLAYGFVGKGKNTMYLRLRNIVARDCFEFMRDNGWDYTNQLQYVYNSWGKTMPADPNEAIAQMPSFTDEFEKMLQTMKQHRSKHLIIDLRGNSGGFTPITLPTLYQLWGDKYLAEQSKWTNIYTKLISPLTLKKYNQSLAQLNADQNTSYIMGDYFFEDDEQPTTSQITDEARKQFIANSMSSVKNKLTAQHGQPVYTPERVYVLTDPGTFSAAFHYAFYLWQMGATVVGVTSRQAPNTYMEQTEFALPRTGIRGSISNALQMFLPANHPRAKDFAPDLQPTYNDYRRYNFDDNTIALYLLDQIEATNSKKK